MKTSRTMHKLTRTIAVSKEPRLIGTGYGYGLTESEMQRFFFEQGFNTSRKTWMNYLAEWETYGLVTHDESNKAYWYAMNDTLRAEAEKSARRNGVPKDSIRGQKMEVYV